MFETNLSMKKEIKEKVLKNITTVEDLVCITKAFQDYLRTVLNFSYSDMFSEMKNSLVIKMVISTLGDNKNFWRNEVVLYYDILNKKSGNRIDPVNYLDEVRVTRSSNLSIFSKIIDLKKIFDVSKIRKNIHGSFSISVSIERIIVRINLDLSRKDS